MEEIKQQRRREYIKEYKKNRREDWLILIYMIVLK